MPTINKKRIMTADEVEFAKEIVEMLEVRLSQGLDIIDLANRELKTIEWTQYEEDFDERIKRLLASKVK